MQLYSSMADFDTVVWNSIQADLQWKAQSKVGSSNDPANNAAVFVSGAMYACWNVAPYIVKKVKKLHPA